MDGYGIDIVRLSGTSIMAAQYVNSTGAYNLTVKSAPTSADIVPIGDSAVVGTPSKQTTIADILLLVPASGKTLGQLYPVMIGQFSN
jgi:hypothetical protein